MKGCLVIIAGFTCSGKSRLINYMLSRYPKRCEIITTYTTRAPRDGERSGDRSGYVFLSDEEYLVRKAQSQVWDEMDLGKYFYASDPAQVYERVQAGMIVLSPMLLKPIALGQKMGDLYRGVPRKLFLFSTPHKVCIERAQTQRSAERVRILREEESLAHVQPQWVTGYLDWKSSMTELSEKVLKK